MKAKVISTIWAKTPPPMRGMNYYSTTCIEKPISIEFIPEIGMEFSLFDFLYVKVSEVWFDMDEQCLMISCYGHEDESFNPDNYDLIFESPDLSYNEIIYTHSIIKALDHGWEVENTNEHLLHLCNRAIKLINESNDQTYLLEDIVQRRNKLLSCGTRNSSK